jgi:probable HAF family extracellular repeat protein
MKRFAAQGAIICILFARIVAAQEYRAVDLGTLPGDTCSYGYSANVLGEVAGISWDCYAFDVDAKHAFLWSRSKGMVALGTFPGGDGMAYAHAINNSSQVVGSAEIVESTSPWFATEHAFLWTLRDGMKDLGALPGDDFSLATSINDRGEVVGYSRPEMFSGRTRWFIWDKKGGMRELATGLELTGEPFVNDFGQVAGGDFLWTSRNGLLNLGTLSSASLSFATGINDFGHIVGFSQNTLDFSEHAFLWSKEEGIRDLGTLPGHNYSYANGISDYGQVVGQADTSANPFGLAGFLWTRDRGMRDLNKLTAHRSGWYITEATAVSQLGHIVAYQAKYPVAPPPPGGYPSAVVHATLLTRR